MAGTLDRLFVAIARGAVGTVDTVQQSTTVAVTAVYKGTAVVLQTAQRGTDSVQRLTRLEGHRLSVRAGPRRFRASPANL